MKSGLAGVRLAAAAGCAACLAATTDSPAETLPPPVNPNPSYQTLSYEIEVNRPATETYARIGGFCGGSVWWNFSCAIISGVEDELGAIRFVTGTVDQILVGKTDLSHTYVHPVRTGEPYNADHATIEARPLTASTSKIIYTYVYDASALKTEEQRARRAAARKERTTAILNNMKILVEGGTLKFGDEEPHNVMAKAVTAHPSFTSFTVGADIGLPAQDVWGKVGGFCTAPQLLGVNCVISSGTDRQTGAVRKLGDGSALEMLMARTEFSYTYTTPVRQGVEFDQFHATLEVKPLTPSTSRLMHHVLVDTSTLPDNVARAADITRRKAAAEEVVRKLKALAEGRKSG